MSARATRHSDSPQSRRIVSPARLTARTWQAIVRGVPEQATAAMRAHLSAVEVHLGIDVP
jgi:DNA-binding FadR family transcriptional regulator